MTRNVADAILKIRPRAGALYGAKTCLQAIDLLIAAGDSTIGKQRQHNIDNGALPSASLHVERNPLLFLTLLQHTR
jgi:hypothetical protein